MVIGGLAEPGVQLQGCFLNIRGATFHHVYFLPEIEKKITEEVEEVVKGLQRKVKNRNARQS